ncbi:hypothetical protein IWW34DRAFT_93129 [Fusarium oxysporum f. sp. albedinis]|nr:hypothetical protein IWW34DRAFT_93129 [Fusarium oxysporum f. sp. albedinis]KAJ0145250.1 Uncharacterized protein HZ326_11983 [Fusarium oxysporum f. sp. albedinis]KAK2481127.1 hypothetical protein H9L39_06766 [Fusarium oxysporum f. sp. albedinis]
MAPTCNVKQKTMTRAQVGQVIRSTSCSSSPSCSSSSSSPSAPGSPSSWSESAVSIGNKRSPMTANNEPPKKRYKPQPDKDSQIVKASNNNKMIIEAPLLKDFTKEFGIPASQFVWGPRETTPEEESFDEDETAPPPSIPNAYQRDPGSRRGRALVVLTKNVNPTPARYQNRTQRGRRGVLRNSPAPEPRPRLPIRIKVKSPRRLSFMGLPAEVREQIYRGLLVSSKPIPVYSSWRRVYQREKPGLDISILMVSKKVFVEARGVMYGENIFLYLLRDAPTQYHEVANIQDLVNDDIYVPEPGMRDQENIANRDTDPLALPIHEPGTIDTAKYAQYFRFITVKADSSRSTPSTKEFMVDAIKMFAKTPYNANIHTLKIIISPSFKHGKFTFVDFFEPASELMVALKSLPCEIIHVQILNKLLNNGAWPSSTDLILRAHQLRFYRQLALQEREDKRKDEGDDRDVKGQSSDLFRTDAKMKNFRFNKLCWIHQKMAQLSKFILQVCEKCAQDDDDKQGNTGGAPPGATDDDEDDWYIYEHDELEESEEEDQDFVQPSDNESDYEA